MKWAKAKFFLNLNALSYLVGGARRTTSSRNFHNFSCFRYLDFFFSICFTSIWRTYFIFLSDVQLYFIFKHILSRLCVRHMWGTYKILLAILDTRILFLAKYARVFSSSFFFFFFNVGINPNVLNSVLVAVLDWLLEWNILVSMCIGVSLWDYALNIYIYID